MPRTTNEARRLERHGREVGGLAARRGVEEEKRSSHRALKKLGKERFGRNKSRSISCIYSSPVFFVALRILISIDTHSHRGPHHACHCQSCLVSFFLFTRRCLWAPSAAVSISLIFLHEVSSSFSPVYSLPSRSCVWRRSCFSSISLAVLDYLPMLHSPCPLAPLRSLTRSLIR